MTDIPEPRFFESDNKFLAHLEWEAIRVICFNDKHKDIGEAYPKYEQRQFYWIDPFTFKASDEHHALRGKIRRKEFETLNDFYQALKPFLKPRKLGKALKDAKKRTSQAAHLLEQLGEDFIDTPDLFKEAR